VRLFVAATSNGFAVLPGGLAMTVDPDLTVSLSAPDGEARDVWVISEATPPPHTSLWRPTIEAARVQRAPQDLPSRAADNLFWLGRYTERADWTMRVLRICLSRLQEDSATRQELGASRTSLEILLSKEDGKVPAEWESTDPALIQRLARNLMTSADWYYGLPRTLDNIHRVAGITRDRLSLEAWRTLNAFYASRRWRADAMPTTVGDSLQLIDDGLRMLAAFHGLTHENMTRNFGWSFLDMGRRLSRAYNLAEVLLGIFGKSRPREDETGNAVRPRVGRQLHRHRSRYRLAPLLPLVLDLLLIDERNPRSIGFQIASLADHIDTLPPIERRGGRIEGATHGTVPVDRVRLADVAALAKLDGAGTSFELQKLLSELASALPLLSDTIGRRYFNRREGRQVGGPGPSHDFRRQPPHVVAYAQGCCSRSISCI
jgi:uncharacterized alpha-E superfamily protein